MKSILYARPRTFGFHTFRRTLASVLVRMKVDIKTVQEILGHQNLKTRLQVYAKAMSEDKLEAHGMFLEELWISWRGSSVRTMRETHNL